MNIDPIHNTQEIPMVPTAGSMVGSARRADRTLFAVVGVAATALLVGAFAVIGAQGNTDASPAEPATPVVADGLPADDQPLVVPVDVETEPDAPVTEPPPVTEPDDTDDEAVVAVDEEPEPPADDADDDDQPAEEPGDEPEAEEPVDAGDPDPDVPEINPCMEAAEEGQQFFVPDSIILEDEALGGTFRVGSCTPDPLAIELSTVPGVLLSHSAFDLEPAGTDVHFIIVPEFFEDQDIEFKVKVYEVDCCADYIDVAAEKTWGLGELAPFDPGIFTMLTDTEGLDPNDADAVTQQFIDEYGWHPGYLDAPEAQIHDEAVLAFIDQYDLPSPWEHPDL